MPESDLQNLLDCPSNTSFIFLTKNVIDFSLALTMKISLVARHYKCILNFRYFWIDISHGLLNFKIFRIRVSDSELNYCQPPRQLALRNLPTNNLNEFIIQLT